MNYDDLQKIGLSDKEAKVYLTSLELGQARASKISSYAGINRGTVYDIARSLFHKGLMSPVERNGVTYFVTHSLEKLIAQFEENKQKAVKLLPEVESIIRTAHYRPKMRFLEGIEGMKTIYRETLKCRDKEMLQFVSIKDMLEGVSVDFMNDYVKQRVRSQIHLRAINSQDGEIDDKAVGYSSHTDKKALRKSRLAPSGVTFPAIVIIFNYSVAVISTKKENSGFIIESKKFTDMMRSLFEVLWNISKSI